MEIGIFGSPGTFMFSVGAFLGVIGIIFLIIGSAMAATGEDSKEQIIGGMINVVALCFLVASMALLPIGYGKQRAGECFDRLPAATFAVDGAFALNEEVLYIVTQGKNDDDEIVRKCAVLSIGTVKDYPGRPIEPGEYWIVVENHKSDGTKWTTNTFVPVVQE